MAVVSGVLGLLIGSFLNVVIYRLPRGESIVYPNSHCTHCGTFLKPIDLIPVISFLFYRARCRYCGDKISWRYPLVELLTAAIFGYAGWLYGAYPMVLIVKLAYLGLLIALAFIDLDTYRLPDVLVIPILVIGLLASAFGLLEISFMESALSAGIAGGFFGLIAKLYPKGMGWGDVKLVAGLGAMLGFPDIFLAIFIASLSGVIIGGLTLAIKGKGIRQIIPFGPYLALGAGVALFWGEYLQALFF